uniref:Uncharacterized protein n=1 Tax=Oryza brachyantha TaxID=4533 RepID=J3L6T2_ORYBR
MSRADHRRGKKTQEEEEDEDEEDEDPPNDAWGGAGGAAYKGRERRACGSLHAVPISRQIRSLASHSVRPLTS